jgi:DNA-binding GntR family transcriptional regulator
MHAPGHHRPGVIIHDRIMSEIDPLSARPVYEQVADAVAARITSGEIPPDRPIPSEQDLADTYGVSRGTARHAVAVLRERGLVVTVPGRGSYTLPR